MFAKHISARKFKGFKPDAQTKGEVVKQAVVEGKLQLVIYVVELYIQCEFQRWKGERGMSGVEATD